MCYGRFKAHRYFLKYSKRHQRPNLWSCPVCVWQLGTFMFMSGVRVEVKVPPSVWWELTACSKQVLWWGGLDEEAQCSADCIKSWSVRFNASTGSMPTLIPFNTHTHSLNPFTVYTMLYWSVLRPPELDILRIILSNPCVNKSSRKRKQIHLITESILVKQFGVKQRC